MRRVNAAAAAATISLAIIAASPAHAQVTVFEGARLIVGNGRISRSNKSVKNSFRSRITSPHHSSASNQIKVVEGNVRSSEYLMDALIKELS